MSKLYQKSPLSCAIHPSGKFSFQSLSQILAMRVNETSSNYSLKRGKNYHNCINLLNYLTEHEYFICKRYTTMSHSVEIKHFSLLLHIWVGFTNNSIYLKLFFIAPISQFRRFFHTLSVNLHKFFSPYSFK